MIRINVPIQMVPEYQTVTTTGATNYIIRHKLVVTWMDTTKDTPTGQKTNVINGEGMAFFLVPKIGTGDILVKRQNDTVFIDFEGPLAAIEFLKTLKG